MLRKQSTQPHPSSTSQPKQQQPIYTYTPPRKTPAGCFGIVASFLVVTCVIAFLL